MRATIVLLLLLAGCAGSTTPATSVASRPAEPPATASADPAASIPFSTRWPSAAARGTEAEAGGGPGPTVTASPYPATPRAMPRAGGQRGPALALSSLRMVSAQAGWATGWTIKGSAGGILHSTDGGGTWQVVSPPALDSARIDSPFFLDASHAWFVTSQGQATAAQPAAVTTTIERTEDGGNSWLPGAPLHLQSGGPGWLDFIDAQHGWYMANLGESGGSMAVEIFQTADGGQSWASVSTTDGTLGPSTPGSLPASCNKTGISFADLQTGWATAHCATGGVFFYTTRDGGRTWRDQPLRPPTPGETSLFQSGDCETSPPVVPPGSNGSAVLRLFASGREVLLFYTQDGGHTWHASQMVRSATVRSPIFVSARDGWTTDESQLFVTHDGGQSWSAGAHLPSLRFLGALDFADLRDGWVTDGVGAFETHDGGQSWLPFSPTMGKAD